MIWNIFETLLEVVDGVACPSQWPTWLRRLVCLTFPISLPIWGLLYGLCIAYLFGALIVLAPIGFAAEMWSKKLDR